MPALGIRPWVLRGSYCVGMVGAESQVDILSQSVAVYAWRGLRGSAYPEAASTVPTDRLRRAPDSRSRSAGSSAACRTVGA